LCLSGASLTHSFLSVPATHLCHQGPKSWLTLYYYEIYYLSAFTYGPVTADLIFIHTAKNHCSYIFIFSKAGRYSAMPKIRNKYS
jgi:hypothetical protein